ncbi:hypothetical protein SAMN05443665_104832 [Actinomadura meyerae]|jgi:hypothetical protein|uniref:Uncharacterized protein n=1 Tax=Actinomadura meyerae TaxID=240840 RepID=A0A239NU26_9ACTN|nr:hypothetical protein SAMN05443665_104832 [Actinomadura meyerae]
MARAQEPETIIGPRSEARSAAPAEALHPANPPNPPNPLILLNRAFPPHPAEGV